MLTSSTLGRNRLPSSCRSRTFFIVRAAGTLRQPAHLTAVRVGPQPAGSAGRLPLGRSAQRGAIRSARRNSSGCVFCQGVGCRTIAPCLLKRYVPSPGEAAYPSVRCTFCALCKLRRRMQQNPCSTPRGCNRMPMVRLAAITLDDVLLTQAAMMCATISPFFSCSRCGSEEGLLFLIWSLSTLDLV